MSDNTNTGLDNVANTIFDAFIDIWINFIAHIPYIIAAVIVICLTWLASKLIANIGLRLFSKSKLRTSLKELILRLITIAIWMFGFLLAAMIAFPGLTPAKALGGLGLASLAIGFAFKDIFENFFAGILLLWRYPFENGDYIECESIQGRIEKTEIRMTLIRETSGELVVVPNSFLFKNPVNVLTNKNIRRSQILTGIAYGENIKESIKVISKAVEDCKTVDHNNEFQVLPCAFGASSIDIEVTWWCDPKPVDLRKSKGEVITAIKSALDEAGIEIPFPQRDLYIKNDLNLKSIENK